MCIKEWAHPSLGAPSPSLVGFRRQAREGTTRADTADLCSTSHSEGLLRSNQGWIFGDAIMTDFDAIIRVASLWLARKFDDEIRVTLPHIDESSVPLVVIAAKLMEGKPSGVRTDDPDTIRRCQQLARHIGASVELIEEASGRTQIFFGPPARQ